jgi:hypothetical protein
MWVRNNVIVAAIVAAAAITWAPSVLAQGQGQGKAPSLAPPPAAVSLPEGQHIFTPPAVLGDAWARAVRAVLDGVKQLVDMEKIEAERIVYLKASAPPSPAPPPPVVPAWKPTSTLRDTLERSPIQVGPVGVAPPTEAVRDTRGERAHLLGARMELPWMVP